MAKRDAKGDGQNGYPGSDKRKSRRINVNLEAKLCVNGQTYSVLIGNISETGLYVVLPVPPGTSFPLEGVSDATVEIRSHTGEILSLPCKKLWSSEVPDSPLVQRVGRGG